MNSVIARSVLFGWNAPYLYYMSPHDSEWENFLTKEYAGVVYDRV